MIHLFSYSCLYASRSSTIALGEGGVWIQHQCVSSWCWVRLSSFHHHPHCATHSQWRNSMHKVPLPSHEGCGPICVGEGGTTGGTQEMGGPCSTSMKLTLCFSPQLIVFQSNTDENSPKDNETGETMIHSVKHNAADETTTEWSKRQPSTLNDNTTVKREPRWRNDDTTVRCEPSWQNDNTVGQITTQGMKQWDSGSNEPRWKSWLVFGLSPWFWNFH